VNNPHLPPHLCCLWMMQLAVWWEEGAR